MLAMPPEIVFVVLVIVVSVLAGGVASVAGFGIGSLLTPLLAVDLGTKLAVAAVAIPHAAGTALRFWRLRHSLDWGVLRGFGLASATGGLVGALLHTVATSLALTIVFALLLIGAGLAGLTGLSDRMRFHGSAAWIAGALSGLFGGLVGNQGGIRSAALLGFPLSRDAFVATATTIALLVDAMRLPVYLMTVGDQIARVLAVVLMATAGVLLGTLAGERMLRRIPEAIFRRTVSAVILLLGVAMLLWAV